LKIFTGSANPKLAEKIANKLGVQLGGIQIDRFPDGETSVQIMENIRGQDIFIIQTTSHPANEHIMELLIVIDAMRRASAARITAVVPYYGYCRQDRKDKPRVPLSAKLVANLLVTAGANRLLVMDLHAQQIQGFFDIPVDHLYAAPVIVKYLRSRKLNDAVVVAPDPGGIKMAHAYSQMLNSQLAIVAKQRKSPNEVEAYELVGEVAGRTAILIDDIITTGGTLCEAAALLKKAGAQDIYAVATHALFVPESLKRFKSAAFKEIIVTDSVPLCQPMGTTPVHVLSVAGLLVEAIRRTHNNKSISSLFKIETA